MTPETTTDRQATLDSGRQTMSAHAKLVTVACSLGMYLHHLELYSSRLPVCLTDCTLASQQPTLSATEFSTILQNVFNISCKVHNTTVLGLCVCACHG